MVVSKIPVSLLLERLMLLKEGKSKSGICPGVIINFNTGEENCLGIKCGCHGVLVIKTS